MTYDPSTLTQEQKHAAWCRCAANAEAILFDALGLEDGSIDDAAEKIVEERDAIREQLAAAEKAKDELEKDMQLHVTTGLDYKQRAESAEARLAELEKELESLRGQKSTDAIKCGDAGAINARSPNTANL